MRAKEDSATKLDDVDSEIFRYRRQLKNAEHWVRRHLLPVFEAIESEGKSFSEEKIEELDFSEEERRELSGIEQQYKAYTSAIFEEDSKTFSQAFVNLLMVFLYHLLEQQLAECVKRQDPARKLHSPRAKEIWAAIHEAFGFDITLFETWPKMDELRRIANVVKHVEGRDLEHLAESNPLMFGAGPRLHASYFFEKKKDIDCFWQEFQKARRGDGPNRTRLDWLRNRKEEIDEIASKHGIANVRVIGSVARGDSGPASDIDFLVTPPAQHEGWIPATEKLRGELELLLGRKVDVVSDRARNAELLSRALKDAIPL
jgi:predicted nucleotidyltransferase